MTDRWEALMHYLSDCENKRRRMRDRPSDAVLAELRTLLDRIEDDRPPRRSTLRRDSTHPDSPLLRE
jgi:hypothetical protein